MSARSSDVALEPDDIRELVTLWKNRLSGDDAIGWLRKEGGISAWYELLATVPNVALAIAAELEGDREFAIEVEDLREYLATTGLPRSERLARLSTLEVGTPMDWDDAVASCELPRTVALRFEAWIARAREIERGPTPPVIDPLGVGARVDHPTFGRGVVRSKSGDTLTIAFDSGEKRVLARFVRPSTDGDPR
jgi:hypothetical protein